MRVIAWTLRIILFLALFLLALKNTETIRLRLYFDQVWQTPLILALLVFFAAGTVIGVLATLTTVFRQRREIARLRRELDSRSRELAAVTPVADGVVDAQSDI
ncbi:MAG: LapA family protein [Burkholderiales bacterium]|nr:LapA family protein [Burkholderiales bacterium]